MKSNKFFVFKNKFLIGTIAFSLATTAVLVPINSKHNIETQTSKSSDYDDSKGKILNDVNQLESIIRIDNSNKNIKAQISYFDQNFNKEVQKNFFNDINVEEVVKHADSFTKSNIAISEKSKLKNSNLKTENFNTNNKSDLKEIVEKIKSGDLSPSSILNLEKKYANENSENYKKIITDIFDNSKNIKKQNKELTNLKYISNSYIAKNSLINVKNLSQNSDSCTISIDKNQYNFFMNLEKEKNRLFQYEKKNHTFAIASATLTAAAWAISDFYWAAWWMFGGNIPFAVAATSQAVVMTYFTTESWNNYYDTKNARINIENYLNSSEYKKTKEEILLLLDEKNVKKIMSDSAITFFINSSASIIIDKLVKKISTKNLSIFISALFKKTYQEIGNNILKNVLKKIRSYLSKLTIKKWIILATNWASPALFFVSQLDSIVSWAEFLMDLILYGIYI